MLNVEFVTIVQFAYATTDFLETLSLAVRCQYHFQLMIPNSLIHAIHLHVDKTLSAAVQMVFPRARAFPLMLDIHPTVNRNVQSTRNALTVTLALDKSAWTLVQDLVESALSVMLPHIHQFAHVSRVMWVIHSKVVNWHLVPKTPFQTIPAIHLLVVQTRNVATEPALV